MTAPEAPVSPRLDQFARRRRAVLGSVLGLIVLGVSGLVLLGVATSRVGFEAVLVGALAALLPVIPVVGAFLWVDRWEPEPAKLLVAAFLWGACGATASALLVNDTAQHLGEILLGQDQGDLITSVISAPLVEEAGKGLFVVALLWRRRHEFDGIVDGIVYSGLVAAGFAFTENIFYFGRAFAEYGLGGISSGVIAVFILRGLLSPFAHPLFTVMLGIGAGIAASTGNRAVKVLAPLAGFLLAVTLHALWNGAATFGGGLGFINTYFAIMVPIFLATVALVIWQRRREQRVVTGELPEMARQGWIAPSEVKLLSTLPGRRWWRSAVHKRSGERASRAVAEYQVAVTELAFLRHRIGPGPAPRELADRHAELLVALTRAREIASGSPG
ncbi:PrsW family intramembrane metalloprotease [Crossiella sp. CA-258035]|uniref:PrsW family intramembrane metalloprotease n=1 Tax=Crossiella sp. CA-258035 TaxID=2981138 RepID=UPI0032DA6C33